MSAIIRAMLLASCLVMPAAADTQTDIAYQQLWQALQTLDAEAGNTGDGAIERLHLRQALERYPALRTRDRPEALAMAGILRQTAEFAVQTGQMQRQLVELEREQAGIRLEASRRDAELARKEAERLRLAALAREEEEAMAAGMPDAAPSKALTEAQAKDAELARLEEELATQVAARGSALTAKTLRGRPGYVLSGTAFKPGTAVLDDTARQALEQLAVKLQRGGKTWLVEGHTDNLGTDVTNLQLSRQRAEAVMSALRAGGLPGAMVQAAGIGAEAPVASNDGKSGRAQNRRVEIIQK